MYKNVIMIFLLILLGYGAYAFYNQKKTVRVYEKQEQGITKENNETEEEVIKYSTIEDFTVKVINERYPYYEPDGVTYRGYLSSWVDELVIEKSLSKDGSTYQGILMNCDDYALTISPAGFGANTVAILNCLIFELDKI